MGKKKKRDKVRVTRENVFQDGPYLVAAIVCERLLVEPDGVKSAIRIVDRVTQTAVGTEIPSRLPPVTVNFPLLLKLKTGNKPGKHEIRITLVDPRSREVRSFVQTVNLEGGPNTGMDLNLNMSLRLEHEGVYWFEVWCDDLLMTKSPLEVRYIIQKQTGPQSPGPIQ